MERDQSNEFVKIVFIQWCPITAFSPRSSYLFVHFVAFVVNLTAGSRIIVP